jgi:hypothetical protein
VQLHDRASFVVPDELVRFVVAALAVGVRFVVAALAVGVCFFVVAALAVGVCFFVGPLAVAVSEPLAEAFPGELSAALAADLFEALFGAGAPADAAGPLAPTGLVLVPFAGGPSAGGVVAVAFVVRGAFPAGGAVACASSCSTLTRCRTART